MKKLFGKRFHRIPVALVAIVMAVVMLASGTLAINGFPFFTGTLQVQAEEAIAVGAFDTWDNLVPYGSDTGAVWEYDEGTWYSGTLGDVAISLSETGIAITTVAETPRIGEGFVAGEWIIIPLNIRNGSSGDLDLSASVVGEGLDLWASFELNTGEETAPIPAGHVGDYLAYGFKAEGNFSTLLSEWIVTVEGYSGYSGSAVHNAQVLFIKIEVPGNAEPATYTLTVSLNRS